MQKDNLCPAKFFEVDLPSVTHLKTQVLKSNPSLRAIVLSDDPYHAYQEMFRENESSNELTTEFQPHGTRYTLITADLADLEDLKSKLRDESIDFK